MSAVCVCLFPLFPSMPLPSLFPPLLLLSSISLVGIVGMIGAVKAITSIRTKEAYLNQLKCAIYSSRLHRHLLFIRYEHRERTRALAQQTKSLPTDKEVVVI